MADLLRWNQHARGWISPDVFIPIAEYANTIAPLTRLCDCGNHSAAAFATSTISFISASICGGKPFPTARASQDLNQYWFECGTCSATGALELTERDALLDVDYRRCASIVRREVSHLARGKQLAFSRLGGKTAADILKIDKSAFTAAIGTDAVNSTVTDIIIALGRS
ncbi:hypothetical protein KCP74_16710 [Salmonella enterica subsp. enterica]|nr:hypothetical protein KCP74_16710 [Salmonella enterica subsp. enterica]